MSLPLPTRRDILTRQRAMGQRIAAVFPQFYPRELLRAYGFHPMELWAPPVAGDGGATEHFQPYTCAIARAGTAFLVQTATTDVDLVLVPHTCDSLQGVGSVLRDFIRPQSPVLTLYHPRGGHAFDTNFLAAELRQLAQHLSRISGESVADSALMEAILAEEQADAALAGLYQRRDSLALSDGDFYRVVRSREYLPNDLFLALCEQLPTQPATPPTGIRLCVSGIMTEPMQLFDELNALGARVVCDDLACGARRLYADGCASDPYVRMAQRLLSTAPEPTRSRGLNERLAYLTQKMKAHQAQALLIYDIKFCEPELFDIPHVRQHFQTLGLPVQHLEVEPGNDLSQQTRTRLQAFMEMLK